MDDQNIESHDNLNSEGVSQDKGIKGKRSATPPIAAALQTFLHRVRDIEESVNTLVPILDSKRLEDLNRLKVDLEQQQERLGLETDYGTRVVLFKDFRKTIREIDLVLNVEPSETLMNSLFIYLFASLDKYMGDLLQGIYQEREELFRKLSGDISISTALSSSSIDELKQYILDHEIETLRRKSYTDQFIDLEKRFNISTLRKFDKWPKFIEMSQRRNLFTHCDGLASKQYMDSCKKVGFTHSDEVGIGEKMTISESYFFKATHLISDVAVMLGHTLWRKIKPEDIGTSDAHLASLVFDFLEAEEWRKAITLSVFSTQLPKKDRTEEDERISLVNYAIALKALDKPDAAKNVLDKKDWSAVNHDFQLAYSVLTEDFDQAQKIMEQMGKEGALVIEVSYHDWPLFREFRNTKQFFDGYFNVYGYKYSSKLSELGVERKTAVEKSEKSDTESN